jgi:hypothetical protein
MVPLLPFRVIQEDASTFDRHRRVFRCISGTL